MRWHRFLWWCRNEANIVGGLSSAGGALVGVRYHRHKGRCLIALKDCDAHEQLFRIPYSAVLQSIDVLETPAAIHLWAQHQQQPHGHSSTESIVPPGIAYTIVRELFFQRRHDTHDDLPLPVVDDWERDMWMLALVMVNALQQPQKQNAQPQEEDQRSTFHRFAGYLQDCLPRNPRNDDDVVVAAYGHLLPAGVLDAALRTQRQREQRVAQHLALVSLMALPCSGDCSAQVVVAALLQWAFACVQTRAHMFSFHCTLASPRQYPLSVRALDAQRDVWYHTLTMCPWFDMINDGRTTNVSFMDVPTTTAEKVSTALPVGTGDARRQALRGFHDKNRDLVIATGPRGLRRGEELTMRYSPVRLEDSSGAASNRTRQPLKATYHAAAGVAADVDIVATLLRFGFLPSLAAVPC